MLIWLIILLVIGFIASFSYLENGGQDKLCAAMFAYVGSFVLMGVYSYNSNFTIQTVKYQTEGLWDDRHWPIKDPSWDSSEKESFLVALATIEKIAKLTPTDKHSHCENCSDNLGSGRFSLASADGDWMWAQGFAHYVKFHNIKPHKEFEKYIIGTYKDLNNAHK